MIEYPRETLELTASHVSRNTLLQVDIDGISAESCSVLAAQGGDA